MPGYRPAKTHASSGVAETGPSGRTVVLSAERWVHSTTRHPEPRPFDRLGAEETEVEGTGMGLALSKGLMEAMGGDLTAESVEGSGTTFTVELAQAAEVPGPVR